MERGRRARRRIKYGVAAGNPTETVQLLLQHGASFSEVGTESFLDAVRVMPLDDIKRLLDGGIDPNCHSMHKTAVGVS